MRAKSHAKWGMQIAGMIFQTHSRVRLMTAGLQSLHQEYTGCNSCCCRRQGSCQCIPGLCYFNGHEIHRHGIKDGFCTACQHADQHSHMRIRPFCFENVQHQAGGSTGGEQAHDHIGHCLCRKSSKCKQASECFGNHVQKPGSPQHSHRCHQPD